MNHIISISSINLEFVLAQIFHEYLSLYVKFIDELKMQSKSHNPNLSLGFPSTVGKTRNPVTIIKEIKRYLSGINLKDRKTKGMLKSLAGIAYFVTLIYFLTILLT